MTELDCALSVEEAHRLIEEIQANPINATTPLEKLTTAFGNLVRGQANKFHGWKFTNALIVLLAER